MNVITHINKWVEAINCGGMEMVWYRMVWDMGHLEHGPYVLCELWTSSTMLYIVKWLTCCSVYTVCTIYILNRLVIKYSNFVWIVWTSVEQCITNRIVNCCVFRIFIVSFIFIFSYSFFVVLSLSFKIDVFMLIASEVWTGSEKQFTFWSKVIRHNYVVIFYTQFDKI